jgi:signal transduction histidine kinase
MAIKNADYVDAAAVQTVIDSLSRITDSIRAQIFETESWNSSPLRLMIEDLLVPILAPTNAALDLVIDVPNMSEEFLPHLRAVSTEAVSNAVRHGRATHVGVSIMKEDDFLKVIIQDNGVGLAPELQLQNGIKNMQTRAQSLGGTMQIQLRSPGGTEIEWKVPFKEKMK